MCDNGKTYYLDNADNALQNYLDNKSYRDKIMIGYYYAYILDFCNSKIALCILMYLYVYNSIRKFTIITIINYLYHDNDLIISIIDLSKLSHSPSIRQILTVFAYMYLLSQTRYY